MDNTRGRRRPAPGFSPRACALLRRDQPSSPASHSLPSPSHFPRIPLITFHLSHAHAPRLCPYTAQGIMHIHAQRTTRDGTGGQPWTPFPVEGLSFTQSTYPHHHLHNTCTQQIIRTHKVDNSFVTIMRHNHEIHLRLEYFVDASKQYIKYLLCYGLESHLDLHLLLLEPSRLSQLSYVLNLVIDPWRLVWVCLDRQDATSQAPLMLVRRNMAIVAIRTRLYIRCSFVLYIYMYIVFPKCAGVKT